MPNSKTTKMWLDRFPVLDESDMDWLETQAAVHEFGSENKMSREDAESKAHAEYKRKHSAIAAAHHLAGMRAAAGEEARKHGMMYALHCKELGCDPSGPVPDEIRAHMDSDEFKHPVKFSAHKADAFIGHQEVPINKAEGGVKSAAFRHRPTGKIIETGNVHSIEPWHKDPELASMSNPTDVPSEWEAGFVAHDGRFLNREEAARHVNMQPNPQRPKYELDSMDDEAKLNRSEDFEYMHLLYKATKLATVLGAFNKALQAPNIGHAVLHDTVEGFAQGIKALPKGSPERMKFITKHMSHAPFLRALQAHPQGKALHGQLMGILNSHANAGLRPGTAVATAKTEKSGAPQEQGAWRTTPALVRKVRDEFEDGHSWPTKVTLIPTKNLNWNDCRGEFTCMRCADNNNPEKYIGKIVTAIRAGKELPPIVVERTADGYELLDGNHRLSAASDLNAEYVPALVKGPGTAVATAKNELSKGDVIPFPKAKGQPNLKTRKPKADVVSIKPAAKPIQHKDEDILSFLESFGAPSQNLKPHGKDKMEQFVAEEGDACTGCKAKFEPGQIMWRNKVGARINFCAKCAGPTKLSVVPVEKNEEVANQSGFFLDAEHQLPSHLMAEGYKLNISHNNNHHIATVHRGGEVAGRVELRNGKFREQWTAPRHGLDLATKMVLSGHANGGFKDGWNEAAGPFVSMVRKADDGFSGKVQGAKVSTPFPTYAHATSAKPKGATSNITPGPGKNIWVRQSANPSNANRTLMVQFSSDLLQGKRAKDNADAYYDKLYKNREGYHRPDDFWELPQWQAHLANSMPNADHYTVRDPEEAIRFANEAGYKNVAFSALDVNRDFVKNFATNYKGNVIVGGYTDMNHFAGLPNVKVHSTIEDFVKSEGGQYNPGYDYRHFSGTKTIPRLTLSDGCLHKCAFCCVPKKVTEKSREEVMQQVDAFAKHLPSDLIYLNDKTFGQAPNHAMLPEIYQRIKAQNPNFKGFVVQTTAAQVHKMDPEFLKKAGIRHAEIGVESFNDPILRAHKKPATEALIEESAQKLRQAGIGLIPNIMVGLPGENEQTYQKTMDWLNRNRDIVSHVNAYNLALYDDSELGKQIGVLSDADKDENRIDKSFHADPRVHRNFHDALFKYASGQLDKAV